MSSAPTVPSAALDVDLRTALDDPRRLIALDAVHNFRDLGGYPTDDGRMTQWGRLYRADGLYRLSGDDLDAVRRLGLRTVIDLRTDEEVDLRGRFPIDYHPVTYHQLSVIDTTWDRLPRHEVTERTPAEFLEWAYLRMLDARAPRFAQAIGHLADAGVLPAVFHCAAGKDRTGVLAMLVLGALGVRHEYIVADYAKTTEATERLRAWTRREHPEAMAGIADTPTAFMASLPEAMAGVLDTICTAHGSVRQYVRHLGVPDHHLHALEHALLA